MNLYQINEQIEIILSQVDENGELPESALDELEKLAVDEQTKIENTALYIKNQRAESDALANEIRILQSRKKSLDNNLERTKERLSYNLLRSGKDKFKTSRVALSFRTSSPLAIGDKDELIRYLKANYADLVKVTEDIDKTGVKKLIQDGHEIPHAVIEDKQNIQIK